MALLLYILALIFFIIAAVVPATGLFARIHFGWLGLAALALALVLANANVVVKILR